MRNSTFDILFGVRLAKGWPFCGEMCGASSGFLRCFLVAAHRLVAALVGLGAQGGGMKNKKGVGVRQGCRDQHIE